MLEFSYTGFANKKQSPRITFVYQQRQCEIEPKVRILYGSILGQPIQQISLKPLLWFSDAVAEFAFSSKHTIAP